MNFPQEMVIHTAYPLMTIRNSPEGGLFFPVKTSSV